MCYANSLLETETEAESILQNEHPPQMLKATYGYCLIKDNVGYLGQLGSTGVNDLIPYSSVEESYEVSRLPSLCDVFCASQ